MSGCRLESSGALELYFYGELTGVEHDDVARHVRSCGACREALEELALIRQVLGEPSHAAAPAGGDWTGFMARLDAAVRLRTQREGTQASDHSSGRKAARPSYAGYLAMAALLALVTASVLFVAGPRGPAAKPERLPVSVDSGTVPSEALPGTSGHDSVLATLSEHHFERSKLVLLGLTTKDAAHGASWEYEREMAASLLNDTRLYRIAAESRGMTRLSGALRDLELVLLQTSMTDERDRAALARIQRLIRKRDVLGQLESVQADSEPTAGN